MKLVLENVDLQHLDLLLEMARALNFKVSGAITGKEEDQILLYAIKEGKKKGRANREEQANFEKWLKTI